MSLTRNPLIPIKMMAVANQAGVRKSITASRSPPTRAKINSINVNSTNDRIMLQRWQGPGFTFVRVISMKLFFNLLKKL